LRPNAAMAPHSNPNLTYFLVIEGGGFVRVGDEQARVAAGDAVVWPPDVVHAAWTQLTPMRALVVEFAVPDAAADAGASPESAPAELLPPPETAAGPTGAGDGLGSPPPARPPERDSAAEEPW
jgi:Cupin domain